MRKYMCVHTGAMQEVSARTKEMDCLWEWGE